MCHCFVFLHNWVFHGYSVLVFIPLFLVSATFTCIDYNVSFSTILTESLKFRSDSRITLISPVIDCENCEYKLSDYSLEAVLQDVAKNNPTKKQIDADSVKTHRTENIKFIFCKDRFKLKITATCIRILEAVKLKVFLKISQNSQKTTCARVSFLVTL